jgi:hypothetical protein
MARSRDGGVRGGSVIYIKTIIDSLHQGTWPVVVGNLSWNAVGAPTGTVDLAQWSGGKLLPVHPPDRAVAKPRAPKPHWGG